MENLLQMIATGGDMATIALLYVMWKFDRRLFVLEYKLMKEGKQT